MKTYYSGAGILAFLLLTSSLLQATKFNKSTSGYGNPQGITAKVFNDPQDDPPPVQNANGAVTTTMEICSIPGNKNNCGVDRSFIYQVQLGDSDPGTVTSISITINGLDGGVFKISPQYGVLECNKEYGAPGVPCSTEGAPLTKCAEANSFPIHESGVETSTYAQTWDFANSNCPAFVAGQVLAIYVDLRLNDQDDPSGDDGTGNPYIQRPVLVTITVNRPPQFVPVAPCRLLDTRVENGGSGPIQGGTFQTFNLQQLGQTMGCADLSTAAAYSLNPAVAPHGPLGYLTIWPAGQSQPLVATLNSLDGRVKANAAIVPAGVSSSISIFASNTTDVVLDIDGYFAPASQSTLAFYALTPCRVADTRDPNQPSGLGPPSMPGGQARDFPILSSPCFQGIGSPAAYSFNFTAVPRVPLGYMTVWPTGQSQPVVSTLNAPTGTVTANAAIVPAGTGGDVEVFPSNDTDLVIDVNGYFAAPGGQNALSLYPTAPCRVLDTRQVGNGQPFVGELTVDVMGSVCAPSSTAQAYVFNATVVPSGPLGYLTLWPDETMQPLVATLNALDGEVTSNMAIVPTNNGSIDAYASNLTQLIIDISSYFAP